MVAAEARLWAAPQALSRGHAHGGDLVTHLFFRVEIDRMKDVTSVIWWWWQ